MRRALAYLLTPLTRWLDRRIDTRIAAERELIAHENAAAMQAMLRGVGGPPLIPLGVTEGGRA